jgi:hypothetical protein
MLQSVIGEKVPVQKALGALKIGYALRSCPFVCALVRRFKRK